MRLPDGVESVRAFSRRVGRSHPTILQAIDEGRVTAIYRDHAGQLRGVYWQAALAEYSNNTDPVQAERTGATPLGAGQRSAALSASDNDGAHAVVPPSAPPLIDDEQDGGDASPPTKGGESGYLEHRAKREKFLAEQAELDYLEKVGALVWARDVDREVQEIFSEVRANAFRIVPKKAAQLAAETDPSRIERLLHDALTQAFHESSRTLADSASGRAEGRTPALP